jgi:hypothetical protein
MKTPTDTEILNWIETCGSTENKWKLQTENDYPHVVGCVFLSRNSKSGHETVREAVIEAMESEVDK